MYLIVLVIYLKRKILVLPTQNCVCQNVKNSIHKIWEPPDSVKGTKYDLFRWEVVVAIYSACEAFR